MSKGRHWGWRNGSVGKAHAVPETLSMCVKARHRSIRGAETRNPSLQWPASLTKTQVWCEDLSHKIKWITIERNTQPCSLVYACSCTHTRTHPGRVRCRNRHVQREYSRKTHPHPPGEPFHSAKDVYRSQDLGEGHGTESRTDTLHRPLLLTSDLQTVR